MRKPVAQSLELSQWMPVPSSFPLKHALSYSKVHRLFPILAPSVNSRGFTVTV